MMKSQQRCHPPDGGWGWCIVMGVFVGLFLTLGSLDVYSLFYFPLMREFSIGYGEVTWMTGSTVVGQGIGFLTVTPMISKLGFRGTGIFILALSSVLIIIASLSNNPIVIFVLVGVSPGVSAAVFCTMHTVLISRYFEKRRGLALGLSVTGASAGTLVLAPLLQFFIDQYGWRGCLLLFGGISLNCAAASALFRPILLHSDPDPVQETSERSCDVSSLNSAWDVLVIPKFWCLNALWFNIWSGMLLYIKFLIPYSKHLHIQPIIGALLLSVYSAINILSRVAFGAIGDIKSISLVWVLIITNTCLFLITASVWFVTDFVGLLINIIVHSMGSGALQVLYIPVIASTVGFNNLTWCFALLGSTYGILGSFIGPASGMLVDNVGEMRLVFIISAAMMLLGMLLHFPLLQTKQATTYLEIENQTADDQDCNCLLYCPFKKSPK